MWGGETHIYICVVYKLYRESDAQQFIGTELCGPIGRVPE